MSEIQRTAAAERASDEQLSQWTVAVATSIEPGPGLYWARQILTELRAERRRNDSAVVGYVAGFPWRRSWNVRDDGGLLYRDRAAVDLDIIGMNAGIADWRALECREAL